MQITLQIGNFTADYPNTHTSDNINFRLLSILSVNLENCKKVKVSKTRVPYKSWMLLNVKINHNRR